MTYYYLAADGSTGGPETLQVLTGMVAGGSVSLATLVVPAGGEDWTPLARVLRFFYSDATGATAGPVAFSELQRLNQTQVLQGQSWVLEEGAEQWRTLESVLTAGGAEVYAPAPIPAQAAVPRTATGAYRPPSGRTQGVAADPYATPRAGGHRVVVRRSGGINRVEYFLYSVLLPFVVMLLLAAAILGSALLHWPPSPELVDRIAGGAAIATLIVGGALGILSIVLAVQRFKNIGWPWFYLFLLLVPLANIWFGLALVAFPPGYAYHKRFDAAAKLIMGIYALLIVGVLVLVYLDRGRLSDQFKRNAQIPGITVHARAIPV